MTTREAIRLLFLLWLALVLLAVFVTNRDDGPHAWCHPGSVCTSTTTTRERNL